MENRVCGDRLRVWLRLRDGRIEQMTWRAEGCALAIDAASVVSELVRGMPLRAPRRSRSAGREVEAQPLDRGYRRFTAASGPCSFRAHSTARSMVMARPSSTVSAHASSPSIARCPAR